MYFRYDLHCTYFENNLPSWFGKCKRIGVLALFNNNNNNNDNNNMISNSI